MRRSAAHSIIIIFSTTRRFHPQKIGRYALLAAVTTATATEMETFDGVGGDDGNDDGGGGDDDSNSDSGGGGDNGDD